MRMHQVLCLPADPDDQGQVFLLTRETFISMPLPVLSAEQLLDAANYAEDTAITELARDGDFIVYRVREGNLNVIGSSK